MTQTLYAHMNKTKIKKKELLLPTSPPQAPARNATPPVKVVSITTMAKGQRNALVTDKKYKLLLLILLFFYVFVCFLDLILNQFVLFIYCCCY
jgi:hypothetical protein